LLSDARPIDYNPPVKLLKVVVLASAFLPVIFCQTARAGTNVVDCDVCVFGGTSGGAAAAVAAARLGKNVALVMVNNHVGGMTSGGLSVTDVGNAASIAGISAEFYQRVGQYYGSTNPVYWFEPHVAEQTFLQMLAGAGVTIYTNELLASVTMSNQIITQIVMADGNVYRAKEYIDTTYEGDLMAMAGVSFTVGREGTNVYGESLAGIQTPTHSYSYSPYTIPGNTNSALLPLVQSGSPGTPGQGDSKVQCYNFRLCLTQVATNEIPITTPADYSPTNYALFSNYIAAVVAAQGSVQLDELINIQDIIPNGKTDINADGELSTDYIGYNFTYPTNTYTGRQVIYQAHKDYIAGLLYYLGTATNVPLNVRTNMLSWGYAADEFTDNGGWPYPLYVREARRMIGDYVMQQQDAQGLRAATDSVALASYTLDSHPVARLAYNGLAAEEGGIGVAVSTPYPVSYHAIVPKVGQCQNLFCTFALSASHVGFASVRLEPVFMMNSQSAGTAAAFAIDDNVPVQQVNYPKLAAELIADGQLLTWSSGQSVSSNGIILDVNNTSGVTVVGSWPTGANPGGWPLPNGTYLDDGNTGKGSKSVTFTPTISASGYYDVYTWWVYASNRATNTPMDISSASNFSTVYLNQQIICTNWVKIAASNYFNAGTNGYVTVRNGGTTGYVIANAVRFMPLGNIAPPPSNPPPAIAIVASDALCGEFGTNTGRFSIVSVSGTNSAPFTVNYSVSGSAASGVDYAALSGSVVIPAGAPAADVIVSPLGDNLSANSATVTLSLLASTNYTITNPASATVTILDRPLDAWRRANFTAGQLANPQISGDSAEPAGDGLSNLMKYVMGLPPLVPATNVLNPQILNGYFTITYSRSKSATDVAVTLQTSADLTNWFSGPAYFQQLNAVDEVTNTLITTQATAPVSSASQAFVRFQVTKQ
jgi:hypothetical protein